MLRLPCGTLLHGLLSLQCLPYRMLYLHWRTQGMGSLGWVPSLRAMGRMNTRIVKRHAVAIVSTTRVRNIERAYAKRVMTWAVAQAERNGNPMRNQEFAWRRLVTTAAKGR